MGEADFFKAKGTFCKLRMFLADESNTFLCFFPEQSIRSPERISTRKLGKRPAP